MVLLFFFFLLFYCDSTLLRDDVRSPVSTETLRITYIARDGIVYFFVTMHMYINTT